MELQNIQHNVILGNFLYFGKQCNDNGVFWAIRPKIDDEKWSDLNCNNSDDYDMGHRATMA